MTYHARLQLRNAIQCHRREGAMLQMLHIAAINNNPIIDRLDTRAMKMLPSRSPNSLMQGRNSCACNRLQYEAIRDLINS